MNKFNINSIIELDTTINNIDKMDYLICKIMDIKEEYYKLKILESNLNAFNKGDIIIEQISTIDRIFDINDNYQLIEILNII